MTTKSPSKPLALHRIALGAVLVAIAAILVPVASAKPASEPAALVTLGPGEIPQVASIKLGPGEIPSVDYGTPAAASPVADGGYDMGAGVAGSAVMLLLLAGAGTLVAIRHSRKAKLSPA